MFFEECTPQSKHRHLLFQHLISNFLNGVWDILLLHADAITAFRPGSLDEWKEMQRQLPETMWGRAEYQAREFAGRLLVPPESLIETLKEFQPLIVKAKQITPDLELPVIKDLLSPKLAKRFFVSDEVIVRRMDAEGISPIQ